MKIVIVEDEKFTADSLAETIYRVEPKAQIVTFLRSVDESKAYFKSNPSPNLIFSDIQLGDGLSFEIFEEVKVKSPIIFCTAHNEYLLNAFKTNGIDYILKPFTDKAIETAIDKYKNLTQILSTNTELFGNFRKTFEEKSQPKASSILIYQKEKIIPIKLEHIAMFYIKDLVVWLQPFVGKAVVVDKTLDALEQQCGDLFFRANRQYLINKNAVKDASHNLSRKFIITLTIPYNDIITTSKEKLTLFKEWLSR